MNTNRLINKQLGSWGSTFRSCKETLTDCMVAEFQLLYKISRKIIRDRPRCLLTSTGLTHRINAPDVLPMSVDSSGLDREVPGSMWTVLESLLRVKPEGWRTGSDLTRDWAGHRCRASQLCAFAHHFLCIKGKALCMDRPLDHLTPSIYGSYFIISLCSNDLPRPWPPFRLILRSRHSPFIQLLDSDDGS